MEMGPNHLKAEKEGEPGSLPPDLSQPEWIGRNKKEKKERKKGGNK